LFFCRALALSTAMAASVQISYNDFELMTMNICFPWKNHFSQPNGEAQWMNPIRANIRVFSLIHRVMIW